MTVDQIRARLADGSPLRLGELARAAGYSREYIRKLADAGQLQVARSARPGGHRRVTVHEAERFLRGEGLI